MKYRLYERAGQVYIDFTHKGKRYRKSTGYAYNKNTMALLKKQGERVLLHIIAEIEEKEISIVFNEFALNVIHSTSSSRNSRTQSDYLSKLDRLIFPYFANFNIGDIKPAHVDQWQDGLLKRYSSTTVKRCKSIMSMVFDKAVGNDLILKNPVNYASKIHVSHEKKEPYSLEEMGLILQYADGWLKSYLYLAFTTGLRTGELLALKFSDLDFSKNVINLKRSITKGIITQNTVTKNHNRLVIVPCIVMEMLKDLHVKSSCEWIFPSPRTNEPFFETNSIIINHFKPLLRMIGVPYRTLYATRHTYISIMRNEGVNQEFILEIAGHSKEVEDKHYYTADVSDAKIEAVNRVFDKLLVEKAGTKLAQ